MNELFTREERQALFPFFEGKNDPLILAGLQGIFGRAFISRDGLSALMIVRDFIFAAGYPSAPFFASATKHASSRFLTVSGEKEWLAIAKAWGAEIEMTRFDMETPARFDLEKLKKLALPPPGFSLRMMDEALFHQCLSQSWSADFVAAYPDFVSFSQNALGVIALERETPVSGCGAYLHAPGALEIEIGTRPDQRRKGLATACGAKFILSCLERGLLPHWDAMNEESRRLAEKLGFGPAHPYPVVCREGE